MGDYEDFPGGSPEWGGSNDPEFAKTLWESLPDEVREKFSDQDQIDVFMRKVETTLKKAGLLLSKVGVAVDPINEEAIVILEARFSPKEDQFQTDKELASMMYDANQDRITSQLEDLRKAAEQGDKSALGFE